MKQGCEPLPIFRLPPVGVQGGIARVELGRVPPFIATQPPAWRWRAARRSGGLVVHQRRRLPMPSLRCLSVHLLVTRPAMYPGPLLSERSRLDTHIQEEAQLSTRLRKSRPNEPPRRPHGDPLDFPGDQRKPKLIPQDLMTGTALGVKRSRVQIPAARPGDGSRRLRATPQAMVQLAFRDVYALQGIRWWSTLGPTRGAAAANRRCRRPAALIGVADRDSQREGHIEQ